MAQKTATKKGGKSRATKRSTRKSSTSQQVRTKPERRGNSTSKANPGETNPGDEEVTINRRRKLERRSGEQASTEPTAPAAPLERRKKVNRRRQIDPTTCERDYTEEEVAFMNALDDYKRKSGRMFPTCSEVLEVVRNLGYIKLTALEAESLGEAAFPAGSAKPMAEDWGPASESTADMQPAEMPMFGEVQQ